MANKIAVSLTKNEMNVLANALGSKIKQLEADVKCCYTLDTKLALRKMFRKHLNDAKLVSKKIHFVN